MKTKVIFSSDENPLYSQFIEPVSKAWENLGFEPICIKLTKEECFVDTEIVPLGNQAQIVRVLYPSLFPNDKFIVSDIDMLPLRGEYFKKVSEEISDYETIVNASADAYPVTQEKFPMCYYAGYGKIFSTITGVSSKEDIGKVIADWFKRGNGWNTDEVCFFQNLKKAVLEEKVKTKLFKRGWIQGRAIARIDRDIWRYDNESLRQHHYIDSHMLRPFDQHVDQLRPLFESVDVNI
jgi:hypothetical protein